MNDLVSCFISNEPDAIKIVLEELVPNELKVKRELNFNLYDIEINFTTSEIHLFDILDADRTQTISISEFKKRLEA